MPYLPQLDARRSKGEVFPHIESVLYANIRNTEVAALSPSPPHKTALERRLLKP